MKKILPELNKALITILIIIITIAVTTFIQTLSLSVSLIPMLFVLSVAQNEAKYYRILYFLNSAVWILYDVLAEAYGNLFTHIVLVIATFIAIIIRDRKKSFNR